MKTTYSVLDYTKSLGISNVTQFLKEQESAFKKRFGNVQEGIELELRFDSEAEAINAYQEIRFNRRYSNLYSVKSHAYDGKILLVSGKDSLFDYLGCDEPNLLTLSRSLNIDFKVLYRQPYSNTEFKGEVVSGELLARQCIVSVSDVLPELSLGQLSKVGRDETELDLLLTRIVKIPSKTILG